MEKCIGYTGFMDAFLCFELLEHSADPSWENPYRIRFERLWMFRELFHTEVVNEELCRACTEGIIEKFEIQVKDGNGKLSEKFFLDANSILETDEGNWMRTKSGLGLGELIEQDAKINIHINPESIKEHLDYCLELWQVGKYFNDIQTSTNRYTSEKQESIILERISELIEKGFNLEYFILKIQDFLTEMEMAEWLQIKNGEEPDLPINPFLGLWSLQKKGVLTVNFGDMSICSSEEPEYRISINNAPTKPQKINNSGENNEDRTKVIVSLKKNCPFSFEIESGIVKIRGQELGIISIGNQEFYFFEYLFENYRTAKTHEEIAKYVQEESGSIDKKGKNIGEVKNFCSTIKGKIPESIRSYIHAPKGKYQLLDSQVRKRKKTSKNK